MTFLINGSSYSTGYGLADGEQHAWPTVFGKLTNSSVLNIAMDGNSVDYLIYSTIKNVCLHDYKKVIIQWGPLNRTLLIRQENNYQINTGPSNNHFYTEGYLYTDTPEFKNYLRLHYKHWSNYLYNLKFSLQKVILLQEFLKSRNCQYLFFNGASWSLDKWLTLSTQEYAVKKKLLAAIDNMDDLQILDEEKEINNLYNQIDQTYYYDPINFNLTEWCLDSGYVTDKHPTIVGQQEIAKFILSLWQNMHD